MSREEHSHATRQSIMGDQRTYGKKHERKRIGREARKGVRQDLRQEMAFYEGPLPVRRIVPAEDPADRWMRENGHSW